MSSTCNSPRKLRPPGPPVGLPPQLSDTEGEEGIGDVISSAPVGLEDAMTGEIGPPVVWADAEDRQLRQETVKLVPAVVDDFRYYCDQFSPGSSTNLCTARFQKASLLASHLAFHERQNWSAPVVRYMPMPNFNVMRIIDPAQLKVGQHIGNDQFGLVLYQGVLANDGHNLQVAVKSVPADASKEVRDLLDEELKRIASLVHPHIVRLLGVCCLDGVGRSAVFEYMVYGDLRNNLRLREQTAEDELMSCEFIKFAEQIANGMQYLSSMQQVHRDLATRNCLFGDNMIIKIADYGRMRACYESDYHKVMNRSWMPVRWMSKEALVQSKFREASDIWAFGVTLWEIFSYGKQPYEGASNAQVIEFITRRQLLDCPPQCPTDIHKLMLECWDENCDLRPSFSDVHARLGMLSIARPVHSILQHSEHQLPSGSSQNGSSSTGSPHPRLLSPKGRHVAARFGSYGFRRPEHASALTRRDARDAAKAYGEDGDSD